MQRKVMILKLFKQQCCNVNDGNPQVNEAIRFALKDFQILKLNYWYNL